jgi:tetratricopeptide (TPR) repeat protein
MRGAVALLLFLAGSITFAQQQEPPVDHARLETECDAKVQAGRVALTGSSPEKATELFEQALAMSEKYDFLENRQITILGHLGASYFAQKRLPDAIRVLERRLELEKPNCVPNAPVPANCADAQMDLGLAKAAQGDFRAATGYLRTSAGNFRLQKARDKDSASRNLHQTREAEVMVYQSLFLAQSGDKASARIIIEEARRLAQLVTLSPDLQPALRDSAQKVLAFADSAASQIP